MKAIFKALKSAENSRFVLDSKYDAVLKRLLKYFEFESPNEFEADFFHIEYQPSDGIVLADNNANVYFLPGILNHIKERGSIKDYYDLKQYRI